MRWVTWVFLGFALSSLVGGCGESEKPPQAKNLGGSGTGGRGSAGTGADGGASGTNTPGGSAGSSSRGGAAGRSGNGGTGASEGGAGVGEAGGGAGGGGASGEGGAGMGGGGGDGGETQTFLDRLWGAYCKQIMTCAISNNDVLVQRLYFGTEAACLEALRELLGDEPPTYDLLARIDSGTVRFVPEMADACITEASDCMWEGYFSNGPACRAVFEGTVPVGGDCNRWEECAGAAYCDHTDGCPGRCALLGEPGAPCNSRQQCSPGDGYAVCDWSANDTCRRLSIGPRAGLDEPCTADAVAATEFVLCEDGLFCDAEDVGSTTGICRMPIAVDEACDSSNDALGRIRPARIRFSTELVSRKASSGMTSGSSGPCTVTR